MISQILPSIRAIVVLTVLTGVLYPLGITAVSQVALSKEAHGSLVSKDGKLVGSELLAQKFESPKYFHRRPSAADFGTVASGASNQGFTSAKLRDAVNERRAAIGKDAPSDLLYASGSGLDPHISPEAASYQAAGVAQARGISPDVVNALVAKSIEAPQLGFLGQPRVNVLLLNQALDELK